MKLIKPIPEFDHDNPLAQAKGESGVANRALHDYAIMGVRRSLHQLEERYKLMEEEWTKNKSRVPRPPTTTWMTISNWSVMYRWQERVRLYDEQIQKLEQ